MRCTASATVAGTRGPTDGAPAPRWPGAGLVFSPVRTVTVGSGFSPDLLTPAGELAACRALAGSAPRRHTAGGDFHPALRTAPAVVAGAGGLEHAVAARVPSRRRSAPRAGGPARGAGSSTIDGLPPGCRAAPPSRTRR